MPESPLDLLRQGFGQIGKSLSSPVEKFLHLVATSTQVHLSGANPDACIPTVLTRAESVKTPAKGKITSRIRSNGNIPETQLTITKVRTIGTRSQTRRGAAQGKTLTVKIATKNPYTDIQFSFRPVPNRRELLERIAYCSTGRRPGEIDSDSIPA